MKHRKIVMATLATFAATGLILGACAPAGPLSYEEALEIHDSLERAETRLEEVEQTLAEIRAEADLPIEIGNAIADAAHEVDEVAMSLTAIRETVFPEPAEPIDEMPIEPAPAAPAGGTL